jgi:hypothetical protein
MILPKQIIIITVKQFNTTARLVVSSFEYVPALLLIRDVYPRSRILIFTQPGSQISDPGSITATEERNNSACLFTPDFLALRPFCTKEFIEITVNCINRI